MIMRKSLQLSWDYQSTRESKFHSRCNLALTRAREPECLCSAKCWNDNSQPGISSFDHDGAYVEPVSLSTTVEREAKEFIADENGVLQLEAISEHQSEQQSVANPPIQSSDSTPAVAQPALLWSQVVVSSRLGIYRPYC